MNAFPGRTSSAPTPGGPNKAPMAFTAQVGLPGAGPKPFAMPPHHSGMHKLQHVSAPVHHHPPPGSGLMARGGPAVNDNFLSRLTEPVAAPVGPVADSSVAATRAPAAAESAATPTQAAEQEVAFTHHQEFPLDCIYEPAVFLKYRTDVSHLPEAIKKFGVELWSALPDQVDRPTHMHSREGFFGDASVAPKGRIIKERQLHHEVLGILARVTPEKYEQLKRELLDLPIRQSDETDVKLVVQTFFKKAIRPEDAPYAEYYVKLIADMINYIGPRENAGAMIRKEIVTQCQATFQNPEKMLTDPESTVREDGMELEEFEMQRKLAKDKNKANINLLGLLFINGLVNERVVSNVLFTLLYGNTERTRGRSRHVPADFEVELFLELLLKVGKRCTDTTSKFFSQFLTTMQELSTSHPSKRIQFKLMDAIEQMQNDFEPKKQKGPKKLADFEESLNRKRTAPPTALDQPRAALLMHQAAGIRVAAAAAASPTAPPPKPIPSSKDVQEALDAVGERGIAEVLALFKEIPDKKIRLAYCTNWLKRPLTVVRLNELRGHIGETFLNLIHAKVLTHDDVRTIVKNHMRQIVQDGDHEEGRYFAHVVGVIKNAEDNVLTPELLTFLMRELVNSENTSPESIRRLVEEVLRQYPACLEPHPAAPSSRRFRVLPTLLMHRPVLDRDTDLDEPQVDMLDTVNSIDSANGSGLIETNLYLKLINGETAAELLTWVNRVPERGDVAFSTKAICALFCYARFDPSYISNRYKEIIKKFLSFSKEKAPIEASWLAELYETWRELDGIPSGSLVAFIKWLQESGFLAPASIEKFAAELMKSKDTEADAQRLKMLVPK